ncbi:MAG: hypothetical protein JSV21_04965 [Nitrospirota bacterium]|nr:MAG: hypothetical protein JSV21_04965 [Nitrospirota bacterium]
MKRLIIILFLILLLVHISMAFDNEPNGIKGIMWASNIDNIDNMSIVEDAGEAIERHEVYTLDNDDMKLEGVDLQASGFVFYENKFYAHAALFDNVENYNNLRNALFNKYGKGIKIKDAPNAYYLCGDKVYVYMEFSDIRRVGGITHYYTPIMRDILGISDDVKSRCQE